MIKRKYAGEVNNHSMVLLEGPDGRPVRKVYIINRDITSIFLKSEDKRILRIKASTPVYLIIKKKNK